ncbi:MAG: undecaprenyl/decaprenyl-phosphate alpha-N-acetylglucosaminyl 1-phosphate transferase [Bacteroidales bacterium]|nr:undecaprenyl/decaprenyl-phosphate alpha-N-acetylglucosaminyl 1-phosphate transferase [Bacteroidales bacterium]
MFAGIGFILLGVAFLVTMLAYPHVLNYARRHNIVDNPNARKLQRVPVPVMGGTAVMIGFVVSLAVGFCIQPSPRALWVLALLLVMYGIGVWDDRKDVSAEFRFLIELVVVWLMILTLGVEVNDFHGLWGIHAIPDAVSVPLSLVAGVGIMNAINLIDGVDGYCSSFGIMACTVFAIVFYYAGDLLMFGLALITIGALIPFFFHNVFGKTSKMFLGDGGSLMLGTLLALFAFATLSKDSPCAEYGDQGLSLSALVAAVLAVPIFDTLKVMIMRVAKGRSPFHPDKTHLHHLFIEMNFSHLATSAIIVLANTMIVVVLIVAWQLGAGINLQFYIVFVLGFLVTWGFYFFMEWHHRQNDGEGSALYQRWIRRGKKSNWSSTPIWKWIRMVMDSGWLGGKPAVAPKQTGSPKRPDPRIQ